MAKQMLIYENPVPLSGAVHRDLSVRAEKGYDFAEGLTSVPLLATEFASASGEFPIVFAGSGDSLFPAALIGLRPSENLFLKKDGSWDAGYVPAFLRRYPFVFTRGQGGSFALCLDMGYRGVNSRGRGDRLFDADGARTRYLDEVLRFSTDYQQQHDRTLAVMTRLRELDLLEPSTASVTPPGGKPVKVAGFLRVSEERLARLEDAVVVELFRSGLLRLIHLHLASLNQLAGLARRIPRNRG